MKVKNIVFSGFAAAILMGTVNAHAAFEIASKAYVDSKVGDNGTITQAVTEIQNSLGDGIGTGDGETTVANALAGKVDKTAVSTSIPAAANASNDKWASEKAVADAIATVSGSVSDVQQQISDALGDLGTHVDPTSGETVPNTVEEVLETKADASTVGDVADLTGFENQPASVVAALNDLQANKLNKPIPNTCSAQSEHCVLHMDKDGNLSWIDITVPYAD